MLRSRFRGLRRSWARCRSRRGGHGGARLIPFGSRGSLPRSAPASLLWRPACGAPGGWS